MSDTPLGRFCWFDLMTTDPDAAPDFYGQVAGWRAEEWDGGPEPYTMWMNGEAPVDGVMELPEEAAQAGAPPHWLVYVSTPDVKGTTAKAKELGATVLAEIEVPTVGEIVVMSDPQGAVFAVFQPSGDTPGHDGPPAMGEFSWHELATDGWEGAWSFYSELFGWEKTDAMEVGDMGTYQMYGRGAHPLGGMWNRPAEMPACCWLFYVRVPDVAVAAERVKELGGQVLRGPMEVLGGDWVAQCMDPQGAAFAVHSIAEA